MVLEEYSAVEILGNGCEDEDDVPDLKIVGGANV